MSNDYAAMQARILDEVQDASLGSQVQLAIQTAIKSYERQRFYFNARTATFATVVGQEYYGASALADIPAIIAIDAAKVTLDGCDRKLAPAAFAAIDAAQDGTVVGDPTDFAYWGQQIRLFPKPSAVRTVTLAYVYRLAALAAGGDTNAWMTDGEELIRQRAKRVLALDVLMEDAMAQRAAALEAEALAALLAETRRRLSNGLLRSELPVARDGFSIIAG